MLKIFCDICGEQPKPDEHFACKMQVDELVTSLEGKAMIPVEQVKSDHIHICKPCYYKSIKPMLNDKV